MKEMALFKRHSTCLKGTILLCICGCLLMGMNLLRKVHSYPPYNSVGQNNLPLNNDGFRQIKLGPHNILPAFMHKLIPNFNVTSVANFTKPSLHLNVGSIENHAEIKTKFPAELHRSFKTSENEKPSYQAHTFYYPWYGTPEYDVKYFHWNHPYIPHWNKNIAKKWPNYTHKPPDDVGSNFYPLLGAYSSKDPEVIDIHMKMMRYAKIGMYTN